MDVNITIIGAGVVGLAIAERLSKSFDTIFVLEKNPKFGQETSSRNSEVIHSGLYYPKDSLKAKLCLRGNHLLYQACAIYDIPHKKCGKLIVANEDAEIQVLAELLLKAKANGVSDVSLIDRETIRQLEPNIRAKNALFVPSTGIIDSHSLMKQLESKSLQNGVDFAYLSAVTHLKKIENGYDIRILDASNRGFRFSSSIVINCAGLESENISKMIGIVDPAYRIYFCKGEYFQVNPPKNKLVNRLVYPVPFKNLSGLGVHATIDLNGGLKLGPNIVYMPENIYDYSVNADNKKLFYDSAKKFLPFLTPEDLSMDMAGIRPKIQRKGESVKDFIIQNEYKRGFKNFINLIGIESPGLTACLAIAEYVEGQVLDD